MSYQHLCYILYKFCNNPPVCNNRYLKIQMIDLVRVSEFLFWVAPVKKDMAAQDSHDPNQRTEDTNSLLNLLTVQCP